MTKNSEVVKPKLEEFYLKKSKFREKKKVKNIFLPELEANVESSSFFLRLSHFRFYPPPLLLQDYNKLTNRKLAFGKPHKKI